MKPWLIEISNFSHPSNKNPLHAIWGHSAPRLAEHHPAEELDDEAFTVITMASGQRHPDGESYDAEIISSSSWHHGWGVGGAAGSSSFLPEQIAVCTFLNMPQCQGRGGRIAKWHSSHLSVCAFTVPLWLITVWEVMMTSGGWVRLCSFVLVCNHSTLSASVGILPECRECVCWCLRPFLHKACLEWFTLVSPSTLSIWSGAKNASQSVSTPPENVALGPFPTAPRWSSQRVRT